APRHLEATSRLPCGGEVFMPFNKTLVGLGSLLLALSFAGPRGAEAAPPVSMGDKAVTPPTPVAGSDAAPAPLDGPTYTVRLRDLAERIDELKEKIRRQHARVSLLGE